MVIVLFITNKATTSQLPLRVLNKIYFMRMLTFTSAEDTNIRINSYLNLYDLFLLDYYHYYVIQSLVKNNYITSEDYPFLRYVNINKIRRYYHLHPSTVFTSKTIGLSGKACSLQPEAVRVNTLSHSVSSITLPSVSSNNTEVD